ncbi:unnamed protein product [Musa textilis]
MLLLLLPLAHTPSWPRLPGCHRRWCLLRLLPPRAPVILRLLPPTRRPQPLRRRPPHLEPRPLHYRPQPQPESCLPLRRLHRLRLLRRRRDRRGDDPRIRTGFRHCHGAQSHRLEHGAEPGPNRSIAVEEDEAAPLGDRSLHRGQH